MRKILLILIILTIASGVFAPKLEAQFYWSLSSQFNSQLFHRQVSLGERANQIIITDDGRELFNETLVNNPPNPANVIPYGIVRGNYHYFSRSTHFFQYGRGAWGQPNNLRLTIGYRVENIEFFSRTYLDRLVRINEANANDGTGRDDFFAGAGDQSFLAGDGRSPNWASILRYTFEEWFFQGTLGFLTAYVGMTGNRGSVLTFNNQSEFLLRGLLVESYGVIAPTPNADFVHDGLDTNNFLRSGTLNTNAPENKSTPVPYLMIAARFENRLPFPMTFAFAADPGNNGGILSDENYRRFHGAFRISGEDIFNRVNIDAIYKLAGGNRNVLDDYDPILNPAGNPMPSGSGFVTHNFGVYANILDVFGFCFGLGYSGYLRIYEDFKNVRVEPNIIIPRTGPLFSGFDFRVRYSGINNLVITSFNNISFANTNTSSAENRVFGVTGVLLPFHNVSQEWFALFNSITVVYNFTEQLSVSAQFARRFGIITTNTTYNDNPLEITRNPSEIIRSRETMGGGVFVTYKASVFGAQAHLQLGFAFRHLNDQYSNSGSPRPDASPRVTNGFRDANGGAFDFAIPIQIGFVF